MTTTMTISFFVVVVVVGVVKGVHRKGVHFFLFLVFFVQIVILLQWWNPVVVIGRASIGKVSIGTGVCHWKGVRLIFC